MVTCNSNGSYSFSHTHMHTLVHQIIFLNPKLRICFLLIVEREEGAKGERKWERERQTDRQTLTLMWETHIHQLPPVPTLIGAQTCSLSMCPDGKPNPQHFLVYGSMLQPTEPPGHGIYHIICIARCLSASVCFNMWHSCIWVFWRHLLCTWILDSSWVFYHICVVYSLPATDSHLSAEGNSRDRLESG